ncbi:protein ANTAGONIST OF LIKE HETEROCHROMATIN PROTEIN 1-like [Varanus komodoensis]|uniref:protein ANTAGONIST OF LIKE HETEROCHROMATIN PROTEIN 1-like n=1 Tax=Varanus komodoensis TaxID=61221 RepID=UPI001CF7B767|nr:protein ANTAGONIST OF LIKE HETEROCHROMATIN PROTEIN 1-like [Varanus komodoensis]XP_044278627.1 protein ANTAGONIST OF LIKE HETEROCHROMATIN PROTEIN 1-like [Varanus komodoensis]
MGEKAALMASMHTILQCIIENHDAEEELFQQHLRVHRMAAEALQQHLSTVRAVEGAVLHFDRDQLWDHTRSFSQMHQRMNVIVEKAQVAMATIAMADHLNTDLSFTRNWTLPRTEAVWASMLELDNWDDARFRGSFRMSRETFDAIAEEISPIIQRQNTVMRRAIPVKKRLALTLYKLAFNLSYLPLSTTFGVGKSTACEIFRDTVRALNHLYLADVIKVGDEEKNIQGFRELGFPYVGASLDSSYIRILAPEQRGPEYHNQKCFYRMVLQAVVDAKGRFMDVYTGLSGKGRDSCVFWSSPVAEKLSKGTFFTGPPVMLNGVAVRPLVLGSQSFAPQPWLLAPFHSPKTSKEKNFNYYHSRARLQAERAFERLKSRWCSLHSLLDVEDDLIADVIVVCCVLHNICESRGDVLLQDNPHLPGPGAESDALPVEPETEQPGQQPPSPRSEAALRREAQAVHAAIADFIWDHNPHVSCG